MSMDIKVDLVNFNWIYESGTDAWHVDTQHRLECHWHIGYSELFDCKEWEEKSSMVRPWGMPDLWSAARKN